jgi:hypothetical protein
MKRLRAAPPAEQIVLRRVAPVNGPSSSQCELAFVVIVHPRRVAAIRARWLEVSVVLLTVPVYGAVQAL